MPNKYNDKTTVFRNKAKETTKHVGQGPKREPKLTESTPNRLCSRTIASLLTTGVPRICSH